jgi:hypothetical protein
VSISNSRRTPPANEAVQTSDGILNQSWANHFQDTANAIDGRVGDYRQTALADAGPNWLLCDGRAVSDVQFAELSAIIKPITGPGTVAGTFMLPSIPPTIGPSGAALIATWIKAF